MMWFNPKWRNYPSEPVYTPRKRNWSKVRMTNPKVSSWSQNWWVWWFMFTAVILLITTIGPIVQKQLTYQHEREMMTLCIQTTPYEQCLSIVETDDNGR